MSILKELTDAGLAHPPKFVVTNLQYLTKMGSTVYGASQDQSDLDVYGFCLPPLEMMFPHLAGEIHGFGRHLKRFENWQEHHMEYNNVSYDVNVFSLPKYFQLLMDNNPNIADSLWTDEEDTLFQTKIAKMVRENRKMFFHKGAWAKFNGYARSQMTKIKNKNCHENPKRNHDIQTYGADLKYCYHAIRLMKEAQQILLEGELDLKRNKDLLISIRSGAYTLEQFEVLFKEEDAKMQVAFDNSVLPEYPDEGKIKRLLVDCIEEFYGKLDFLP